MQTAAAAASGRKRKATAVSAQPAAANVTPDSASAGANKLPRTGQDESASSAMASASVEMSAAINDSDIHATNPSTMRNRASRARKALEQQEARRKNNERHKAWLVKKKAEAAASAQRRQDVAINNKLQEQTREDQPGRSPKKKRAELASNPLHRVPAKLRARHQTNENNDKQQRLDRGLMSVDDFLSAANSEQFPEPPQPAEIADAVRTAADALDTNDVVCAVCDCFVPMNTSHDVHFEEWTEDELLSLPNVTEKLHWAHMKGPRDSADEPVDLAEDLKAHYDVSDMFPKLAGFLLSKHKSAYSCSQRHNEDGTITPGPLLRVCRKWHCAQSLCPLIASMATESSEDEEEEIDQVPDPSKSKASAKATLPPPNAISNHNVIGALPSALSNLTWPEAAITCRAYACARINVLKAGNQKALQGHITTVEQNTVAIAQQLPLSPEETTFRVVIAGALTPAQKLATFKVHQVRRNVILQLLQFYQANNRHYSGVQLDLARLNRYTDASSLIDLQGDSIKESEAKMMDAPVALGAQADSVGPTAASAADADTDISFAVRHVTSVDDREGSNRPDAGEQSVEDDWKDSFADSARHLLELESVAAARAQPAAQSIETNAQERAQPSHRSQPDDVLAIRCGSKFLHEDRDIYVLMFPELFPYGRGGMDEFRRVKLSLSRWVQRLMHESSGRFGSPSFVLKVYNVLARAQAAQKCFLRVQLRDMSFAGLTTQDVRNLVEYQLACSDALRMHQQLPEPPASLPQNARDLYRTMELCTAQMQHTDQYAKKFGRMRVFAMWNKFGPPALMLTLNPNDLASMLRLFYCGLQPDAQLDPNGVSKIPVPPSSVFNSSLGEFPGAAALDFKRKLDIFIRHVIGYDLQVGAPVAAGGVYGKALALFCAVEEQNRGSLHAHVLVWLPGVRPFSQLSARDADGWESLRKRISDYVQSIMTAEVQIPPQFVICPREAQHHGIVPYARGPEIGELVHNTHIGQIPDVRPFRLPLKARAANVGPPEIAVCLLCDDKALPKPSPFSVQFVTQQSIAHARASLDLPPVDPAVTSTFNQWSADKGPIVFPPNRMPTETRSPTPDQDAVGEEEESFAEQMQAAAPAAAAAAASASSSTDDHQRYLEYLVDIATVQVGCMSHDPAHRATCAKKGPHTECRFHFPFVPHMPALTQSEPIVEEHDAAPPAAAAAAAASAPSQSLQIVSFIDEDGSKWKDTQSDDVADHDRRPSGIVITLPRSGLSAYQNQTNLAVTGLYRCNNDVKLVQDPGSAFYITLYHVKTHDEEKKQLLDMVAAVERAHSYHVAADPSLSAESAVVNPHTSSLQLALRAARAASSSSAISAPCAAYFLLGGERFISSEEFGYILLGDAERKSRGESDSVSAQLIVPSAPRAIKQPQDDEELDEPAIAAAANVDSDETRVYVVNGLSDYKWRDVNPDFGLNKLSWWEYEQDFKRVPRPEKLKASNADRGLFLFAKEHPLYKKWCAKKRDRPATPIVYGDRLPDARTLIDIDADPEAQETFALRAMMLFYPFNVDSENAPRSWARWKEVQDNISACAKRVLKNMQSYWEGSSKKMSVPQLDGYEVDHAEEEGDEALENAGELQDQLQAMAAAAERDATSTNAVVQLLMQTGSLRNFPAPDLNNAPNSLFNTPCSTRDLSALKRSQFTAAEIPAAPQADTGHTDADDQDPEEEQAEAEDNAVPGRADWVKLAPDEAAQALASAPADVRVNVGVICGSATGSDSDAPEAVLSVRKANAGVALLRYVITTMQLNTKQTQIFSLFGHQFLGESCQVDLRLAGAHVPGQGASTPVDLHPGSAQGSAFPPVLAFLGGAAGTGKSRVIHAIKLLYQLCGKSSSLLITATTGVAAVALGACTIHSALHLMSGGKLSGNTQLRMRERLAPVTLLIIDEVSMLGTANFAAIESRLSAVRPSGGRFGGISVLFVGDFCQFSPVAATPLISSSAEAQLWKDSVTTVVMLDEQMRQADDPTFAKHLQAFREGHVSAQDVVYFNAKFAFRRTANAIAAAAGTGFGTSSAPASAASAAASSSAPRTHYNAFVPIVVAENKDRVQVNNAVTLHLFTGCDQNASAKSCFFAITSVYQQTRSRDPVEHRGATKHPASASAAALVQDGALKALLALQCTNKTDHVLRCFPGMEVVITDNLSVEMGIANGSRACVVGVQLTECGAADLPVFDSSGMRQYNVRQIARVILHLLDASGQPVNTVVDGVLPAGQFSVFPFDDYEVTNELKKNKALRGHRLPFRFKRIQFPFVPAFSLTAHKTQGLTLPKLILAATLNRMNKAPTDRYLYVVLSRLRGLGGLTLLQALPHHSHKCYRHSANLTAELERLRNKERQTVSSERARMLARLLPPARVSPGSEINAASSSACATASAPAPVVAAPAALSSLQAAYLRIQARAALALAAAVPAADHIAAPLPNAAAEANSNVLPHPEPPPVEPPIADDGVAPMDLD